MNSHLPRAVAARLIVPVVAAAVALSIAGCGESPGEPQPDSIAIGVTPGEIDAALNFVGGSSTVSQAFYDPLLRYDTETDSYEPWLVEEFSFSEDGKTLHMRLRDDVRFVDGERLDAAALKTLFDRMRELESFGYTPLGAASPESTVTGEFEIDLTTSEVIRGGVLKDLNDVLIMSPAVEDIEKLSEPAGTGPYLIDDAVPGVSISVSRNPDYWNPDAFDFDSVTFLAFEDKVAALNALKSGQVNATIIDAGLVGEAEASGLTIWESDTGFTGLYIVDHRGAEVPALADVRVRRALNMAFDQASIIEKVEAGLGHVSSQPFLDGAPESAPGGENRYPYDPEAARALLADAGYPDGFTMTINSGYQIGPTDYGPIIESSLADIGVSVEWVNYLDEGSFYGGVLNAEMSAAILTPRYDAVISIYMPFLVADNPLADPRWAELYAEYQQAPPADFPRVREEAAEYIVDQALFVPISHTPTVWATSPGYEVSGGMRALLPPLLEFKLAD